MKEYLAVWHNGYQTTRQHIFAENVTEAKARAFRSMCDSAGDRIHNVEIYEYKTTVICDGEFNPQPMSHTAAYAEREYLTGKKRKGNI